MGYQQAYMPIMWSQSLPLDLEFLNWGGGDWHPEGRQLAEKPQPPHGTPPCPDPRARSIPTSQPQCGQQGHTYLESPAQLWGMGTIVPILQMRQLRL